MPPDTTKVGVFLTDLSTSFENAGRIAVSPLHAAAGDLLWAMAVFGSTGALMTQDEALRT